MSWEIYKDIQVNHKRNSLKKRYSATADVLSYRRCARQYAFYSERDFVPSLPNQIFIGTIIHEVLDRAHGYFQGKRDPATKGNIPSDNDIKIFFDEVERALKSQGMRVPTNVKDYALRVLIKFNRIEGPTLYPRVLDTEHRLQTEREEYILHGVVDVLLSGVDKDGNPLKEIWDYKGTKKPKDNEAGRARMDDYIFQMQVYANLYKLRNLSYPNKAIIYFLGELDKDSSDKPENAKIEVDLSLDKIDRALSEFDKTVSDIEISRSTQNWPAANGGSLTAGEETCIICDLRWNCPEEMHKHPKRDLS